MGSYLISEQTRLKLIEAAGELFAEKGIEGVSTREIARKAGTAQNAIAYHFNGIGGLIEAVWAYVLVQWNPSAVRDYLASNQELLKTTEGQNQLVGGLIDLLFHIMYRPDRAIWINKFLVRCAMSDSGKAEVSRTISGCIVPLLLELYVKLTGDSDAEAAHCWALRILSAPMVLTARLTVFAKFCEDDAVNLHLYEQLKQMTIHEALHSLALARASIGRKES
ncbi:MAG: helix-turn-helix domain containing protein [Victivallaceae bacterium]|nr:helix-turn-helix domain containing protein [Victivallaceae bacterium]